MLARNDQPLQEGKTYTLVHPVTKIRIQCSEKFLLQWISRGFHITEVILEKYKMDDK